MGSSIGYTGSKKQAPLLGLLRGAKKTAKGGHFAVSTMTRCVKMWVFC